jgi:hypothetical protein
LNLKHFVWVAGLFLVAAGCGGSGAGPGLVKVDGTVTLDGQPVANATISFLPDGSGEGGYTSPAYGQTDEDGYYKLMYSISKSGANPGKYKVEVSTFQEAEPDADVPARPETIPVNYNQQTELSVEVMDGGGPYDFELKSGGKVVQPRLEQ